MRTLNNIYKAIALKLLLDNEVTLQFPLSKNGRMFCFVVRTVVNRDLKSNERYAGVSAKLVKELYD